MMFVKPFLFFLSFLLLGSTCLHAVCPPGQCQLRSPCSNNADCASGLFCSSCAADGDPSNRCHRYQATPVASISGDLPFNRYAWLTTHNAYAIVGAPMYTGPRATFTNQEDSVTDQLKNGVRGFMLDMYDFLGDIWLCHSFGGVCYNFTAFEPAINTLKEISSFLSSNPNEIVTIFIEDYVKTPNGLTNLFKAADLWKYFFPVSKMPKNGEDWPTLTEIVTNNYRLIVFTSDKSKEQTEGIAYNWRYVNENQYGNGGLMPGSCPNRSESLFLNATSRSLLLWNFFPDDPVQQDACQYNSASLEEMLPVCYQASGRRWANYLAVDFYKRSDGGGAFDAVDTLNAWHICGCSDINDCKLKLPYGLCNTTTTSSTSTSNTSAITSNIPSAITTSDQPSNTKSMAYRTHNHSMLLFVCIFVFMLV